MSESVLSAAARVDALGGAGAEFPPLNFPDRAPTQSTVMRVVDKDTEQTASERATKVSERRAHALSAIAAAMAAGGQDLRHWRPADATTAWSIAELLIGVMDARTVELPAAFRQGSAPADQARGDVVAKAIAGQG